MSDLLIADFATGQFINGGPQIKGFITPLSKHVRVRVGVGGDQRCAVVHKGARSLHSPRQNQASPQQSNHQGDADGRWKDVEQAAGPGGDFDADVALDGRHQGLVCAQVEQKEGRPALDVIGGHQGNLDLNFLTNAEVHHGCRGNVNRPVRSLDVFLVDEDSGQLSVERRVAVVANDENLRAPTVSRNTL